MFPGKSEMSAEAQKPPETGVVFYGCFQGKSGRD
jgi:hypothetical protein